MKDPGPTQMVERNINKRLGLPRGSSPNPTILQNINKDFLPAVLGIDAWFPPILEVCSKNHHNDEGPGCVSNMML